MSFSVDVLQSLPLVESNSFGVDVLQNYDFKEDVFVALLFFTVDG